MVNNPDSNTLLTSGHHPADVRLWLKERVDYKNREFIAVLHQCSIYRHSLPILQAKVEQAEAEYSAALAALAAFEAGIGQ